MAEKLNLAVFIDYDNLAIGVKNSINRNFNYEDVRRWLESKGEISSQVAYGNWSTYHDQDRIQRTLARYGVEVVNRASLPGGKNGADIALSLDALELVFTQEHINAFCILSGDSDFIPLVIKLKTHGKRVYVVGGTEFSNENLRRNCHEFISYESLCRQAPAASQAGGEADREEPPPILPLQEAVPVVREAVRKVRDRGLRTFTWNLKAELRKVGFDERAFGYEHFQELIFRLVDDGHFRKQPIGDKFYIAEVEGDTGPAEPPPERPAFVPGGAYRPVSALTDAERAVATIRQALASIDRAAKAATLDMLYETILEIDPGFPSYGCSHADFKQFVARLVAQHHFKLEFKNGVCLVLDNAAGADSGPVEPVHDGREDWQRAMQRILRDNASLLRNGMPSKQLEAILAAKAGPDGTRPDSGMIRSFLRFAVREDLLAKEVGADDTVWYSLPEGQDAALAPASDPGLAKGPPRPVVAARGGDRAATGAGSSAPEALSIVRAALRGHAALFGTGLQRSGLRAAVLESQPDFEVADYGLRSFRELLDRLCEQGFLETKDSGDGLRYFGTDQLASADAPDERPSGADRAGFQRTDQVGGEPAPQPESVAVQPSEKIAPGEVAAAPARARSEEAPATDAGDASKEAVGVVRTALSGNAALAETGLPRRGLRAAILAARPDFDVRTYGLRSFRELVDRVCEAGYLEARNDPDDGALYFGTDLLASAAPAAKKPRRGAGRSRESAPAPEAPSVPSRPPVTRTAKKPTAVLSEGLPGAASAAPAIGLKRFLARFGKKPGGAASD